MDVSIYLHVYLGLESDYEYRNGANIEASYGQKAKRWNLVLSD